MPKRKFIVSVFILLLFCSIVISGCSIKIPNLFPKEVSISDLSSEALLFDKDAIYNRTLSMIQSAQKSIYVEQFAIDDPQLIELLLAKSRSGIDVHILLDQWQKTNRSTLDFLKSQNVSIQFYPAQKGQVNHTKILVVDQDKAIVYGPSWTATGLATHDLAVELSGKAAWKTASIFLKDWTETTTLELELVDGDSLKDDHITLARNTNVKQQLSSQIEASKSSIWIENAELTDPDLVQALLDAAVKGLDVRLIGDRDVYTDNPKTLATTLATLKTGGVKVRYYPEQPSLGMRLAIFDGSSFVMGSSVWTEYAFLANHEFSITVPSPVASKKLTEIFNQDWAISAE